jgi:hypothetical protein
MIGTGCYYWFTQGRTEEFLVGRIKTTLAVLLWPIFLIYLYLARQQKAARHVSTDEAKKRILG